MKLPLLLYLQAPVLLLLLLGIALGNTAEADIYITKLSRHTNITVNTQLSVPVAARMK